MVEGWFTGKKLSDYFGGGRYEPVGARRIINGTDKDDLIAGQCGLFVDALRAAGHSVIPGTPQVSSSGSAASSPPLSPKGEELSALALTKADPLNTKPAPTGGLLRSGVQATGGAVRSGLTGLYDLIHTSFRKA
jgi:putative chitinase